MTNESAAKPSRHYKFQLILGAGFACLIAGGLISFTVIGLPLGIPLVMAGVFLIVISPAFFKPRQALRSRQEDTDPGK